MAATNEEVIELLKAGYCMELETVINYLANSTNLDGVRAEEIKKSLAADIVEELGHAQVQDDRARCHRCRTRYWRRLGRHRFSGKSAFWCDPTRRPDIRHRFRGICHGRNGGGLCAGSPGFYHRPSGNAANRLTIGGTVPWFDCGMFVSS